MSKDNTKPLISKTQRTTLYFDSTTGNIETDEGHHISTIQARSLWQTGVMVNSNISFQRLAIDFDFDVDACLKWYKEQD